MYRHALCLYPYREDLRSARYYPPLGLEIVARAVQPFCREIEVVDLRHERADGAAFVRPDTELVCLSINWDRHIDQVLRQIALLPPGPRVVVGGRCVSADPARWLTGPLQDAIAVRGDGEEAVVEIAQGRPLETIAGISYRRDGENHHNPVRRHGPLRDDLYPDRRLRRYRYMLEIEGVSTGIPFDSLSSSRGCPFHCRFCSFSRNPWGEKRPYAARSPESVVRELAEMEAEVVIFTDDIFSHDLERAEALSKLIVSRGLRKRFVVNARVDIARRMDVVRRMEQAGFTALLLGIESASDRTLRSMHKGQSVRTLQQHFQALRKARMLLHGYFILGCVGESEEEVLEIAPFARRLGVDTLGLSPLRTAPHDGLQELVAATPGYSITPDGFVYSDAMSRQRLRELRRVVWRRFYTPGHVARLGAKLLGRGVVPPGRALRLAATALRAEQARRRRRRARRRVQGR